MSRSYARWDVFTLGYAPSQLNFICSVNSFETFMKYSQYRSPIGSKRNLFLQVDVELRKTKDLP